MNATAPLPTALVITRNLPPLIGGMERLIWHIVDELRPDYQVHVIGPRGCRSHLPPDVTATEVPTKPMPWYLLRTKLAALWQALRRKPSLVLAGSGLTGPFAWLAARLTGARCIVYLHGLDIEVRHPIYRLFWRPFFRHCDRALVNSRFTRQLARDAGVAAERIVILHPGVEIPDATDAERQRAAFREHHDLGNAPLMLYVGRITARKGLAPFVRDILPDVVAAEPDARLIVIGDEPSHALHHQPGERERVLEALQKNGLRSHVLFLKEIGDKALSAAYFAADVLVFPVQERLNDHEGFGMVAVEAAAHGLPTVAFAVGGVTDAISHGISGVLVPPDDTTSFIDAVQDALQAPRLNPRRSACRRFAAQFDWPVFGDRLRMVCRGTRIGKDTGKP